MADYTKQKQAYEKKHAKEQAEHAGKVADARTDYDSATLAHDEAALTLDDLVVRLGSGEITATELVNARATVEIAEAVAKRKATFLGTVEKARPSNGAMAYGVAEALAGIVPDGVGLAVVDPGESIPRDPQKGEGATIYLQAKETGRAGYGLGSVMVRSQVASLVPGTTMESLFSVSGDGRADVTINNALSALDKRDIPVNDGGNSRAGFRINGTGEFSAHLEREAVKPNSLGLADSAGTDARLMAMGVKTNEGILVF